MENKILLNYNIQINSFTQENNIYIIRNDIDVYYFVPYLRPDSEIKELYEISEELLKKNIGNHSFVFNKKNHLITNIDNQNYVLLKINFPENTEFKLNDIYEINELTILKNPKTKLHRNDWGNLWSEKIDYFEYQMQELGMDKKIVHNSFSYYVGLAENAISYINFVEKNIKNNDSKITLSRKRIFSPNYSINYLNPLNYVLDLQVRDIAEYIKAAFFDDNDVWDEIDILFKKIRLNSYECHMLFARLLYPSYYFDVYEKIMNHDLDEHELIPVINKCDLYEEFLIEIYNYLNNFTQMTSIDWLLKK